MKNIAIIGAGMSGLSTGIFALLKGYNVTIYEKNSYAGGCLTGWERDGYYIDNCMHWLTGTIQSTFLFKLWKKVGAFDEASNFYQALYFYKSIFNDCEISFLANYEKTRKDLLKLSLDDEEEINKLFNCVKMFDKALKCENKIIKKFKTITSYAHAFLNYKNLSLQELANRFSHPCIRKALTDYLPKEYSAIAFILAYSTFASGNGKVYLEGSKKMASNILDRYLSLGGKINYNCNVTKINTSDFKKSIIVNNEEKKADIIVSTVDPFYTFNTLLDPSFMDENLKEKYASSHDYPLLSSIGGAFLVSKKRNVFSDTVIFDIDDVQVGTKTVNRLIIKDYSYLYPHKDKTVFQYFLVQDEDDYEYLEKLKNESKEQYYKEKETVSINILNEVIKKYPSLKGNVTLLDTWTPLTYTSYYNSYYGSYMGFSFTNNSRLKKIPFYIKNLDDVYFVSIWNNFCGGLPVALENGYNFVCKYL